MKAPLFFLLLNLVSLPTEAHPPAFKLIALGGAGRAFGSASLRGILKKWFEDQGLQRVDFSVRSLRLCSTSSVFNSTFLVLL
jgi:hypothetical protein